MSFPSLTPSGGTELYFGYAVQGTTASVGTTSGFTYALTASGNVAAFDPDVSGAASPTATEAPAGISSSIGVLPGASNGSPPPTPTVTGVSPSTGSTAGFQSLALAPPAFEWEPPHVGCNEVADRAGTPGALAVQLHLRGGLQERSRHFP